MSTRELPKITFKDKTDSWKRNQNSRYVLTADNVNEIKDVVNSLSDAIADSVQFAEVYAELRVQVPDDLPDGRQYDLEIQLAKDTSFENEVVEVKLSTDPGLFMKFEEGEWKPLERLDLELKNKLVKISMYEKIKDKGLLYFGRFKFSSISPAKEGDWNGFCLGSYAEGDSGNKILEDLELVDETGKKLGMMSTLDSHACRFRGKDQNGQVVELTDVLMTTSSEGILVIDGTSVSVDKMLWQPKTAIIDVSGKYMGVDYSLKAEVYAYPVMIKRIVADFPEAGIPESQSKVEYRLSGITFEDQIIPGMESEVVGSVFEAPWAEFTSPGTLGIDRTQQIKSGKDELLMFWSWHGRLVDFSTLKMNVSRYECLQENMEIIQSSIASNPLSSLYISHTDKIYSGATYKISVVGKNGNASRIVPDAMLSEELSAPGVDLWKDEASGWMISGNVSVDTPFILKASAKRKRKHADLLDGDSEAD